MLLRFTTIPLLFAALPALTSAGCFSGGQPWANSDEASISDAANHYKGKSYQPGVEAVWCENISGHNVKFILQNKLSHKQTISYDRAYTGFHHEYTGCDHGGDTTYDDWRFYADPNEGSC